jgi:hypothetical protein
LHLPSFVWIGSVFRVQTMSPLFVFEAVRVQFRGTTGRDFLLQIREQFLWRNCACHDTLLFLMWISIFVCVWRLLESGDEGVHTYHRLVGQFFCGCQDRASVSYVPPGKSIRSTFEPDQYKQTSIVRRPASQNFICFFHRTQKEIGKLSCGLKSLSLVRPCLQAMSFLAPTHPSKQMRSHIHSHLILGTTLWFKFSIWRHRLVEMSTSK